MTHRINYSACVALAAVVGCASLPSVGPDYEEPAVPGAAFALPDAGAPTTNLNASCEYVAASAKDDARTAITPEMIARWWTRFNDPILDDLVARAVTSNIDYRVAQKRFEQASWELQGAYAAFLPQLGVDASWSHSLSKPNTLSGGGRTVRYDVSALGLGGSWEIDIFGGSRRLAEARLALMDAAELSVYDTWVAVSSQLGEQYVNLRTTQELIAVARTNLVLQSETYDILKSRLDSGIGDELAVNQCAYVVEQTRAKIPTLLAQEESIKNAIAVLVGEQPGALHAQLAELENDRDWLLEPQRLGELPLDQLRYRPDVRAVERRLAAQTAKIGVAKSQWFPKLFLNGNVGWQAKDFKDLFNPESVLASFGPSVSWPIFQGGAIYANVKATEAETEAALLAYELALKRAYGEVRSAYSAYTWEYHRFQSLAGAVKAATDAVSISKDLYKNGLKDFTNVIDAQRSRLQFEEDLALSRGQITQDLIALYRTLGGGLDFDASEEDAEEDE